MEYLDTTMKIIGCITAVGAAIGVLFKLYKWIRKPSADNSTKLTEHDKAIKDLQDKAAKDYEAIQEIKTMQAGMCQALIAMMDHQITGNHVDGLKKTKRDLIKMITEN